MSGDSDAVATVGRDDFFNDPFFKDWWADFDDPSAKAGKQLDRQISGMADWRFGIVIWKSLQYFD